MRLGLIALIALPCACGGTHRGAKSPQAEVEAPEEGARRVASVEIRGNRAFSDSTLAGGLANRVSGGVLDRVRGRKTVVYDPLALESDRLRLESYYQARGYFSARVTDVEVTKVGSDAVNIVFTLEEGRRSTISGVAIRLRGPAIPGVSERVLKEVAGLAVGDPMVVDDLHRAERKLRNHLADAGHAFAAVRGRMRVSRKKASGEFRFWIDPGPKVRFGETRIVGLDRVPVSAVLARLEWERGETFSPSKLEKSRARLNALGVFSTVNIELEQTKKEVADVIVKLAEGPRHEVKLGGGAGVDALSYEGRLRGAYTERGWWLPLLTLRIEARPSYSFLINETGTNVQGFNLEGAVGLTKEDFLIPLLQGTSTLTYALRRYYAYTIQGPRAILSLRRLFFDDRLRIAAGWQFRFQWFLSPERDIPELGIDYGSPYRVGFFEQRIAYDRRDDVIDPRRGMYVEVYLEEAGTYAGSNFDYVRVSPEYRLYWPLIRRIVLAHRTRYGRQLSGDVLPITQRYFAGGASGQRGFPLQQLSPRLDGGLDSAPVGGRAMIETTIEARADIKKLWGYWLGVVAFLDGGDAVRDPSDLDLTDLHWAAGGGLRWRLPIGPVRVDVARRLNRYGPGELDPNRRWAFHLSLGEAF